MTIELIKIIIFLLLVLWFLITVIKGLKNGVISCHFKRKGNIIYNKDEAPTFFWITILGYILCIIGFAFAIIADLLKII